MSKLIMEELLDEELDSKRKLLSLAIQATILSQGDHADAAEAFKKAVVEYFDKQNSLFLAEMNKIWPEKAKS